jgi:hypothetical protein
LRSASAIAYGELTKVRPSKLQSVSAGETSRRHAAEKRMLASRKARSGFSVNAVARVGPCQDRGQAPSPRGAQPGIPLRSRRCSAEIRPYAQVCSARLVGVATTWPPVAASWTQPASDGIDERSESSLQTVSRERSAESNTPLAAHGTFHQP